VRYVVIDPATAYRAAITTDLLPNAALMVDRLEPASAFVHTFPVPNAPAPKPPSRGRDGVQFRNGPGG
jgi:hypothetical protein